MELVSYDFDDTLVFSPTPEKGKEMWEKNSGLTWQGKGWWGNPESLNVNYLTFPTNGYTYNKIKSDLNDPNKHVFVATGRITKLQTLVREILEMNNIFVDEIFCNPGGDTFQFKCGLFEEMINKHKPEIFTMYDDRQEHMQGFKDWADRQSIKVVVHDVINKTIYSNYK